VLGRQLGSNLVLVKLLVVKNFYVLAIGTQNTPDVSEESCVQCAGVVGRRLSLSTNIDKDQATRHGRTTPRSVGTVVDGPPNTATATRITRPTAAIMTHVASVVRGEPFCLMAIKMSGGDNTRAMPISGMNEYGGVEPCSP
jgi:hypothetical protein